MDHEKRLTLALALCFLLAMVYFQFGVVPPPKKGKGKKDGKQSAKVDKQDGKKPGDKKQPDKKQPDKKQPDKKQPDKKQPGAVAPSSQAKAERRFVLQTEQFKAVLSNRGAAVVSIKLKQYFHRYADRSKKDWRKDEANWLPLFPGWSAIQKSKTLPEHRIFELDSTLAPGSAEALWVAREEKGKVVFELGYSNGLLLTKTIALAEGGRSLSVAVELANKGKQALEGELALLGPPAILRETQDEPMETGVWLYQGGKEKDSYKEPIQRNLPDILEEKKDSKEPEKFRLALEGKKLIGVAVHDKYFAGILWVEAMPGEGQVWARPSRIGPDVKADRDRVEKYHLDASIAIGMTTKSKIEPGKRLVLGARLEVGSREALSQRPFEKLLDYGFFSSFSSLLLWILGMIYKLVGNYGWSIIILTVLIKVCLYPLTKKQQVSMHTYQDKIKKFQPEMEKLKEKHKNNKQKMNEELLKLYRKHNVQPIPVGGCLPVLIQIPIFFGLFRALQYSIALRQAPWLWVTDLSGPDKLVVFEGSYLLIGHNFNILPIVMTAVWFMQQKMMPKPTDPQMAQQQKMMMFLPIVFGFMLYSFASGLCLYWFVSNLIGIFEQKHIKAHINELTENGG